MTETWKTSTYTGAEGNCVETRLTTAGVGVRDTKDRTIPALRVSPQAWQAFLSGATAHQ